MAGSTTTTGSNSNNNGGNNNINNGNGSGSGGGKVCCNVKCAATTSVQWRSGWQLRSGGFANLCDDCGLKYEQIKFCESFHLKEDGWRACNICEKPIHCGCIASFYSFTLADNGGIECINCVKKSGSNTVASNAQHSNLLHFSKPLDLPAANLPDTFVPKLSQTANAKTWLPVSPLWQPVTGQPSTPSLGRINEVDKSNVEQTLEKHSGEHSASIANKLEDGLSDRMKSKDLKLSILDSTCRNGSLVDPSKEINGLGSTRIDLLSGEFVKQADQLENPASACLNISLGSLVSKDDAVPSILGLAVPSASRGEIKESKVLTTQTHRQRRQNLPKIAATSAATNTEAGKEIHPQVRVARPPGEGRAGRGTLLPRYWPRITDQELQQISGDSNSMITPLFEKVLSASDAGRIGRLVLPKACAEAYFPTISQPEGQPLKIQDAKGKEWVFQFRFWPNNNSRMYVLEGVTPCIQSMQLQAGDTVTFSRLETDGRLVMGFRKASNSANQEGQTSSAVNGNLPSGGLSNNNVETVPTLEGLTVLPARAVNGNSGTDIAPYAGQMNASDSSIGWYKNDTSNKLKDNSSCQHLAASDKRRNYTHGLKSKRLRIDNEDSLELKLTWEEAQDLLRPPLKAVPSIVMIEGHEFEEYEEPPVFGKRTIFTTNQAGEKNQWAQCDDCCSWRRLPVDAFLPPRWTCADNTWDPKRAFCSASQEVTSEELDKLIQLNTGSRKPEISEGQKAIEPSSGLDTLANVAALGENDNGPPLAAATTKHPRHRPGCSCIVCIQPPSGKGPKHKPTCTCNVCMTVKRRFKTLMMRRKKRQYEREAENAKKKRCWIKDEGEVNSGLNWQSEMCSPSENISRQDKSPLTLREGVGIVNSYPVDTVKVPSDINIPASQKLAIVTERTSSGKGQIDLNSHPEREDELPHGVGRVSMMRLLHDAGLPLEMYLKQQGLASLVPQSANTTNIVFEMHSNDQRIDEQSCPPNLQTQEEVQEEQFLTPNRVKSDGTSVSA